MSDTVIINSQQVDDLLNKLNDKDQKNKWLYDAVMSGAKVLQQSAQQSFIRKVDGASHNSPYLKGNKPFYESVSVKGDKAYVEASVSIMNDFRMKFFEKEQMSVTQIHAKLQDIKKMENTSKGKARVIIQVR